MRGIDPNILSVEEAARLAGTSRKIFAQWLHDDPDFRAAVVVDVPGRFTRVSRPRLLRRLHGDAAPTVEAAS